MWLRNYKNIIISLFIFIYESSSAKGIGSQSWGEGLSNSEGLSNGRGWDILLIISVIAICYWFAFSSKSPLAKRGFLWQLGMFLFGPAIIITTIIAMIK